MFVEPQGGHLGILDCRVDSEPLASLTLYRGSQLIASNQLHGAPTQPHIRVTAPPNALRLDIDDLGPSNQGEYVCTASNALGSASASAYFGTRGEGTNSSTRWNLSAERFSRPKAAVPDSFCHQTTCLSSPNGSRAQGFGEEVKVKINFILVGSPWEGMLGA